MNDSLAIASGLDILKENVTVFPAFFKRWSYFYRLFITKIANNIVFLVPVVRKKYVIVFLTSPSGI